MANEMMSMGGALSASGTALSVFSNAESFNQALRMADCLARSTIVPKTYQGNVGNCMIAIEMASRINTSPMMVMQNLYIVNGNPAWSSQWIIAMINSSRKYKTELQFEFGHDEADGGLSCRAWVEDRQGHRVEGPKITMTMAKDEGWLGKNGSKWKTMPEVMIRYRAASFFGRVNCPDMVMGIYTSDEVYEMGDTVNTDGTPLIANPETGEVLAPAVNALPAEEEDPVITQDQRQALFKMVRTSFGTEGDGILRNLLAEEGYDNSHSLKRSAYSRIVKKVFKMSPTGNQQNHGKESADSPAPQNETPEDDGEGTLPWREDDQTERR